MASRWQVGHEGVPILLQRTQRLEVWRVGLAILSGRTGLRMASGFGKGRGVEVWVEG